MNEPIIILGAPRSGTTFLGDVLARHSALRYFIEPSPVWRRGNERRSDALRPEHARPEVVARIRNYFETACREDAKPRILEKTPQNCLRVPFVDAVFPEAKYVHILRNGYEAALSIRDHWLNKGKGLEGVRIGQRLREIGGTQYFKYGWQFAKRCLFARGGNPVVMWGPLLPGIKGMRKELSLLEISAYQWKQCTEMACMAGRRLGPERYREMCLTDLDRDKVLEILAFLDLEAEPGVMAYFDDQYSKSATSYRRERSEGGELAEIEPIIQPTMEWLEARYPGFGN